MSRPIVSVITSSSNSGRQAALDLLRNGARVRAVFRSEGKADLFRGEGDFSVVTGVDADKPDSLGQAFTGSSVAVVVTPHDPKTMDLDATRSITMIDAAVASGVDHIAYVGSWTTRVPERVPILAARFCPTEAHLSALASESKITYTNLRAGFFHQNFGALLGQSVKKHGIVRFPGFGLPSCDPRDIGSVAASVAMNPEDHKNLVYDISGPARLYGADIASIIGGVLKKPVTHELVDADEFAAKMPPYLRQVFSTLDDNEDAVPLTTDVTKVTGKPARGFANWVEENKAVFGG